MLHGIGAGGHHLGVLQRAAGLGHGQGDRLLLLREDHLGLILDGAAAGGRGDARRGLLDGARERLLDGADVIALVGRRLLSLVLAADDAGVGEREAAGRGGAGVDCGERNAERAPLREGRLDAGRRARARDLVGVRRLGLRARSPPQVERRGHQHQPEEERDEELDADRFVRLAGGRLRRALPRRAGLRLRGRVRRLSGFGHGGGRKVHRGEPCARVYARRASASVRGFSRDSGIGQGSTSARTLTPRLVARDRRRRARARRAACPAPARRPARPGCAPPAARARPSPRRSAAGPVRPAVTAMSESSSMSVSSTTRVAAAAERQHLEDGRPVAHQAVRPAQLVARDGAAAPRPSRRTRPPRRAPSAAARA